MTDRHRALIIVKLVHTGIWACLAGCMLVLPIVALCKRFDWAVLLTAVIVVECGVLAANRGRCPLTNVAARYTDDRADNFDIYLPLWLARHNKALFGSLFLGNELIVLWRWFLERSR